MSERGGSLAAVFAALGGVFLVFLGALLFYFVRSDERLTRAEIEFMRRDGLFPGEPDWMRGFRVAQSEQDLDGNMLICAFACVFILLGALLLGFAFYSTAGG